MPQYTSFRIEQTEIIIKALQFVADKIGEYYEKILKETSPSFHESLEKKKTNEIERLNISISFLEKHPDLNIFSMEKMRLQDLANVIRSSLSVYSREVSKMAERHDIDDFRREKAEIERIILTEILRNAKTDLYDIYYKIPTLEEAVEFFVSYSTKDKKLASKICAIIQEHRFKVFLAHRDIKMSKAWRDEILLHLESCTVFVALCTKDYLHSVWGNQEAGIALEKDKKVIPLFYKRTTKSDFAFLETKQGPSKEIAEENVSEIIEEMLSSVSVVSHESLGKTANESVAKERIKEDLTFLRKLIVEDLKSGLFARRGYPLDMLSKFSDELARELSVEKYRQIQKTYNTINTLGFPSNDQSINKENYEKTVQLIDKTLELLT